MLSIGTAEQALCRAALEAPGGFLWWYLDLVNSDGDGVVLIWAFGLPFLPGRESAARRGAAVPARQQPSLAVSVYAKGKPAFYLLQEYGPDDADVDLETGRVRLGESRFHSRVVGGRRVVDGTLDMGVPRNARLQGTFHVDGAALDNPVASDVRHVWSPLTTATEGTARFELDGRVLADVVGRAYHDANGSTLPLSGLGIREWAWGREAAGAHEEVHYVLWPSDDGPVQAHLLRLHADGQVEVDDAEVTSSRRAVGWFGMPWHRELTLRTRAGRERVVTPGAVVDDGPFYLRSLLGAGTAEWVRPSRVDLSFMRPFIRMCVHRPRGNNAWLLPFFTGERATRWQRLLGRTRPALPMGAP